MLKLNESLPEKNFAMLDEFRIIKSIGSGKYAKVKLAIKEGKQYAIKRYKNQNFDSKDLENELAILNKLNHQNVVKLYEMRTDAIYKKKSGVEFKCFAIVLEYIEGEELYQCIAKCIRLKPEIARTFFAMLLSGIKYLHDNGIAHRDLKPQNIMIDKDLNLKIVDFGFSTLLSRGELHTKLGTQNYMAPEVYLKKYDGRTADLFSAGVILFVMYKGESPFQKATPTDDHYKIFQSNNTLFWKSHQRLKHNGFFSDQFKDLMNKMLCKNPEDRLGIQQIIVHPWLLGPKASPNEIKGYFQQSQQQLILTRKQREKKEKNTGKIYFCKIQIDTKQILSFSKTLFNWCIGKYQPQDKEDLIIKDPKSFISWVKQFLYNKTHNIITNEEEQEIYKIETDSKKPIFTITSKYSYMKQNLELQVKCRLLKVNANTFAIRFLKDRNNIKSHLLVQRIKQQFVHSQK